jgi:hypothetical protein
MRLSIVDRRHRLRHKLILLLVRVMSRRPVPDVVKTLLYRPEYFGRPFSELLQSVMRGDSDWSVGERELFAAFTSSQLACEF